MTFDYSPAGDRTDVTVTLSGTLPLARVDSVAVPPTASDPAPHSVTTLHIDVDSVYGIATRQVRPNGAEETFVPDPHWHQFVTSRTVRTGTAATGFAALTSSANYDIGLGRTIAEWNAAGSASATIFDGLNRPISISSPNPLVPTMTGETTQIDYPPVSGGVRRVHVRSAVDNPLAVNAWRDAWTFHDGFDATLATVTQADPSAHDGGAWTVTGLTEWSASGMLAKRYVAKFWNGDPRTEVPTATPDLKFVSYTYDAIGRPLQTLGLDQTAVAKVVYHPLSTETYDAEDLFQGGPHENTPGLVVYDGHHRAVHVTEQSIHPTPSSVTTDFVYLPTGELSKLTRTYDKGVNAPGGVGKGIYVRTMVYDTLGRLVQNIEPNTSAVDGARLVKAWTYAFDNGGQMVASADARGCGANYFFDVAGRKIADDYVPCTNDQPVYSAPNLATGEGTEAFYRYDNGEPGQTVDVASTMWRGRLSSISDRSAHTRFGYDGRGRQVRTSRQLAKPNAGAAPLDARYAPHWFERTKGYDYADRVTSEATGADVDELLSNTQSNVVTEYTARGLVKDIAGSYGVLVSDAAYDEEGFATSRTLGDISKTTSTFAYETGPTKRLKHSTISRAAPISTGFGGSWSAGGGFDMTPIVQPTTLSDVDMTYDRVGSPMTMIESPAAFDASAVGAKPASRSMEYDDRYRLTKVTYDSKGDTFKDPLPSGAAPMTALTTRVATQTFDYDGVGNTTRTTDDANAFFDRSLGDINNGAANQMASAGSAASGGTLSTQYDSAGNLTSLTVYRTKACFKTASCNVTAYAYVWDEVGHLASVTRTDNDGTTTTLAYAYDASGARVLTTRVASSGFLLDLRYNAEIFPSLRLNSAHFDGTDFERTASTEAVYLMAGSASLGRLVYLLNDAAGLASGKLHVFFELGDMLGSTSFVIDQDTSDIVERRSYQAYGGIDAEYQADAWKGFREEYGFTGKEADLEMGLTYFGARYYSPELGRFISPDPLAIHSLSADLNPYAYVSGRVAAATDPHGLAMKLNPNFMAHSQADIGVGELPDVASTPLPGITADYVCDESGCYHTQSVNWGRPDPVPDTPFAVGSPAAKLWGYSQKQWAYWVRHPSEFGIGMLSKADQAAFIAYAIASVIASFRGGPPPSPAVEAVLAGEVSAAEFAAAADTIAARQVELVTAGIAYLAARSGGPSEPYNRAKHYGRTPTKSDRDAVGAGPDEVADHDPPLVKRYYEGDPANGEKPGYEMTEQERAESAGDQSRMSPQPRAESNAQGGAMRVYSMRMRKIWGL